MTSLIALAPTKEQAQRIVHRLQGEAHLTDEEISVLLPGETTDQDYGQTEDFLTDAKAAPSSRTHGVAGGLVGAVIGAGAVLIPGMQVFLAAGPAVMAFSTLIGGLAGGAIGALAGLGLPDAEVQKYRDRVKHGAYLLAIHADDEAKISAAHRIFQAEGGEEIRETRNAVTTA